MSGHAVVLNRRQRLKNDRRDLGSEIVLDFPFQLHPSVLKPGPHLRQEKKQNKQKQLSQHPQHCAHWRCLRLHKPKCQQRVWWRVSPEFLWGSASVPSSLSPRHPNISAWWISVPVFWSARAKTLCELGVGVPRLFSPRSPRPRRGYPGKPGRSHTRRGTRWRHKLKEGKPLQTPLLRKARLCGLKTGDVGYLLGEVQFDESSGEHSVESSAPQLSAGPTCSKRLTALDFICR